MFLGRVNYPNNCHTLDLTKDSEVEEKGLQRIWFEFENLTNPTNFLLRCLKAVLKARHRVHEDAIDLEWDSSEDVDPPLPYGLTFQRGG